MDYTLIKSMERFKAKRLELGLSFQKLADKTGMSKATLQRYEAGDIRNLPIEKIKSLATALEITPTYLLGWEDTEKDISNATRLIESKKSLINFLKCNEEILSSCNIDYENLQDSNWEALADDIFTILKVLSPKYK